jgi:hypothetical protein
LIVGFLQQLGIPGLRHPEFRSGDNVVAEGAEKGDGRGVDILVGKEFHGVAAK